MTGLGGLRFVQLRAIVLPLVAGDRQFDRGEVSGTRSRVSLHVARNARTCDGEAKGGVVIVRRPKRNSRVVVLWFLLSGMLFYLFQRCFSFGVVVVYHGGVLL